MKIGILQSGHLPDEVQATVGDYDRLFDQLLTNQGLDLVIYNVVDMEFPASIHDADGWLVTGSRHGAYDDLPFIPVLEDLIREVYAAEIPLVGICFGHQLIAQALGGHVEKFRDGWAVGRQTYAFEDGRELALNAWHQDQVITPPKGARTIASNAFCDHAALLYGDKAFTVQAHPEFDPLALSELVRVKGDVITEPERVEEAVANLNKPLSNQVLAEEIAAFFKGAKHG